MNPSRLFATATIAVLVSCLSASANWQEWTDANGTHRWNDAGNWTTDQVPSPQTNGVALNSLPGPTISGFDAVVKDFVTIGSLADSNLTISNGGSLKAKLAVTLGYNELTAPEDIVTGTLLIEKGSSMTVDQVYIGTGNKGSVGKGHLILDGGTINCTYFVVARLNDKRAEGSALLKSGTIECLDFNMGQDTAVPPKVDIWDGKIVQRRNDVERVKDWVRSKWIVGYGGKGVVVVQFDTDEHPGCTVITAKKTTSR